jgi:hypothetical protein
MGFSGPGWAGAGAGRAFGLGPNQEDRICFYFPKLFSIAKTIPVKTRNCLKAQKILRKSQQFQENSQRQIGTRTIQIKYLVLMENILEPSTK